MAIDQIRFPYGNAFLVKTPALDRYAQNLYLEQRQREIRREQEMKQLDDEFARNVAGIRDADVGDLTKAYGTYKLAYKDLLKKPQGGNPQEQLDVLRKKADLYNIITQSKNHRLIEEDVRKGLQKNPDVYEDEAHNILFQSIRTPLSQMDDNIRNHDYSYKGTDTDFQKVLGTAAGTPKEVYQKEEPVDKSNLQFKVTPYLYGNTPLQFKDSLLSSLGKHRAGRDAAALIANTPQSVIDKVDAAYHSIPADRWQQMGVKEPQQLSINDATTPQDKFAIHQAQLYALNNLPKEGKPTFRNNTAALEARREGFQLRKLAIQHANAADLIKKRHDLTQGDKELEDLWIDEYVDKKVSESKLGGYREAGKEWQDARDIQLDPVLENAMRINGKPADFMKLMPDGSFRYGFYKREKDKKGEYYIPKDDKGRAPVDDESIRTITKDGVKLALGKQAGVKQMNKEMSAGGSQSSQETFMYNGKSITRQQLENAAKASGLTVDEYKKQVGIK